MSDIYELDERRGEPAVSPDPVEHRAVGDDGYVRLAYITSGAGAKTWRVAAWHRTPNYEWHDYYETDKVELARGIMDAAERELSARKDPDLKAIAADLKGRDAALPTLERAVVRGVGTGVILGDTSPDELPGAVRAPIKAAVKPSDADRAALQARLDRLRRGGR